MGDSSRFFDLGSTNKHFESSRTFVVPAGGALGPLLDPPNLTSFQGVFRPHFCTTTSLGYQRTEKYHMSIMTCTSHRVAAKCIQTSLQNKNEQPQAPIALWMLCYEHHNFIPVSFCEPYFEMISVQGENAASWCTFVS